jgi:release factor glutamine methyltransferase
MDVWNVNRMADQLERLNIAFDREAMNIARWIWTDILGFDQYAESSLSAAAQVHLNHVFDRLLSGEPIQYIAGHAWFFGLSFKVTNDVLIPRPETEELVDWMLSDLKYYQGQVLNILDVGTGSGCIAITLKKHLGERAHVTAVDISSKALEVAAQNGASLHASVEWVEHDFLKADIEGLPIPDIIVSNPPYISRQLAGEEVVRHLSHEPAIALYPNGDDPDIFYKKICDLGSIATGRHLTCYLELNEFRAAEVARYFRDHGWGTAELRIDMQGMPRMLKATRSN